ncbi:MAG: ABC transporter permease [Actinobacteria bacterium]|nr:ABC transporter permease [Actinomycetota bacterium]
MLTYVSRRLLYSVPVVIVASFLMFWMVRETYDPCARLRASRDAAAVSRCEERLRLDDPVVTQYGRWLGDAVRGDLGESSRTHEAVEEMIPRALWSSVQLIFWGVLISAVVAIALGVYSAVRQYSVLDYTFTGLSFLGLAMPPFWFGLLAIELLAVGPKRWFDLDQPLFYIVGLHSGDSSGFDLDYLRHLVLPVMTLTVQIVASWSRFQRAEMLDVMSADYVRTARAKGVPRRQVILRHGLRNALVPLLTVMALDIGALFGGVIVTETIFSIPGMGSLFVTSLSDGDAPVLAAWVLVTASLIVAFNLLADVLYSVLDPRVRLT